MKITLCGSIAFFDEMLQIKNNLETMGHEVKLPPIKVPDENGNMIPVKEYYILRKKQESHDSWIWDKKAEFMQDHFNKVEWSDIVLILNYDKKDIPGYVGGNTLLEMGLAFHLNKKIFLLNQIPEMSYTEEILGMKPTILNGDLNKISN